MDPVTASIVYGALISGGISALSGKRGGDILKDAALGAATGAVLGPGSAGAKDATTVGATEAAKTAATSSFAADPNQLSLAQIGAEQAASSALGTPKPSPSFLDKTRSGLESFSDLFRYQSGPKEGTIDPLKVGVGAGTLGAGLYAAGVFDPKTPPPPKTPGANLIYYSQPEAFRPFGGQEIDPSKFPEKPYANMQEGGIANLTPASDRDLQAINESTSAMREIMLMKEIEEMKNKLAILSEAYGKDIVNPSTNQPGSAQESTSAFKDGALVDQLPSKTNKDENNKKNYKRTSGKLVVDANGKGSENKDTMLAQLADGEFVTKSAAVRGAGIAMGASPKDKEQQRQMGAEFFYKQMAALDKLARSA
jgi:hypothetical protein